MLLGYSKCEAHKIYAHINARVSDEAKWSFKI